MQSSQCLLCVHYLGEIQCDAYPDRIPDEIITGLHDHREPYPGDNGIRFKPLQGAKDD